MNVETQIDEFKNTDQLITESIDFCENDEYYGTPTLCREIYGLLYFSPDALSMEEICTNWE